MPDASNGMYEVKDNIVFASGPPKNVTDRFIYNKNKMASASRFSGVTSNTTVTSGYGEDDGDFFRPEAAIPKEPTQIIAACMQAYDKFPIVRNIIDMMADFTVKGIDIVNKSKEAQQFARDWASRINLRDRAERIAHMLYLGGTVPIERQIGTLPSGYKGKYKAKLKFTNPLPKGKIPIGYVIHNPANLIVPENNDTTQYPNVNSYSIINYTTPYGKDSKRGGGVISMPKNWLARHQRESETTPLDSKKNILLFYKRMDFDVLPKPLTYPLLSNLRNLDKLTQCDYLALDGAISRTVLWRLGVINEKEPDKSIFPTEEAYARLSEILAQSPNGGVREIVWGPELDFKEVETNVYEFLGIDKYVPTLNAIREGYGVPESLTGGQASAGFTNNVVSLKTLSERLEYGRNIIIAFLEYELAIIQDAMGFRYPFQLVFDQPTISDEAAEKKLMIELYDRAMVSKEFVQERYGAIPEIENARILREEQMHKSGAMPPKAGPYHSDSLQKNINERSFVNNGYLTPSQVGLIYPDADPKELDIVNEINGNNQEEAPADGKPKKKRGVKNVDKYQPKKQRGRPKGAVDEQKRKKKTVVPLGFSNFMVKASAAKAAIDEIVKPAYLSAKNKENSRQLSGAEFDELENLLFATLYSLDNYDEVTPDSISSVLDNLSNIPNELTDLIDKELESFSNPTTDTIRQVKMMVIASDKFGVNNNIEEKNNED